MTQHIGIVACSAEGAALCYRTLCAEGEQTLGRHAHPEISLHSLSFADYVSCLDRNDWRGVAELMLRSAHKLASVGADFLICPDNTVHKALARLEGRSPLPWLHIAACVSEEASRRGFRNVAILGTRWLVDSEVYPEALRKYGLDFVRPSDDHREDVHRIIMDELVRGQFRDESVAKLQAIVAKMKSGGCDAVALGCTELPLVLNDANSALPTLDSTRLLARAALRRATSA